MKGVLYFLAGGAIGSVVTYLICKSSYKEALVAQAEEIHGYYKAQKAEEEQPKEESKEEQKVIPHDPTLIRTYNNIVTKYSANVAEVPKVEHVKQTAQTFGPYPISSGEFGENGYEPTMTWTHYANGVLVDADGHELSAEEIDRTIGLDYADHFGDVDDDNTTLYIRNEELQCDFEIFDCGEEEYYPPTINGPSND